MKIDLELDTIRELEHALDIRIEELRNRMYKFDTDPHSLLCLGYSKLETFNWLCKLVDERRKLRNELGYVYEVSNPVRVKLAKLMDKRIKFCDYDKSITALIDDLYEKAVKASDDVVKCIKK